MRIFLLNVEDIFFNRLLAFLWVQTDLFLYSYEAEFIQNTSKSGNKKLAKHFNLTFRYIDDVLSLNNSKFSDNIDLIYLVELEIKGTTDSMISA